MSISLNIKFTSQEREKFILDISKMYTNLYFHVSLIVLQIYNNTIANKALEKLLEILSEHKEKELEKILLNIELNMLADEASVICLEESFLSKKVSIYDYLEHLILHFYPENVKLNKSEFIQKLKKYFYYLDYEDLFKERISLRQNELVILYYLYENWLNFNYNVTKLIISIPGITLQELEKIIKKIKQEKIFEELKEEIVLSMLDRAKLKLEIKESLKTITEEAEKLSNEISYVLQTLTNINSSIENLNLTSLSNSSRSAAVKLIDRFGKEEREDQEKNFVTTLIECYLYAINVLVCGNIFFRIFSLRNNEIKTNEKLEKIYKNLLDFHNNINKLMAELDKILEIKRLVSPNYRENIDKWQQFIKNQAKILLSEPNYII